ncbi:MAG: hypothetical protein LBM60_05545 [Clostridium sp.]|jgi:hypothetical protein|nr:hypothetical protein [Clostridium sp.]
MDNKKHHLDMLQSNIQRMSTNSFTLKGWAVTLVAGIFALSSKDADRLYFLIVYMPVIAFWFLDAYYLLQERLLRSLFDRVRLLDDKDVDFSMNTFLPELYSNKNTYLSSFIAITEIGFYLPLAFLSTGIIMLTCI